MKLSSMKNMSGIKKQMLFLFACLTFAPVEAADKERSADTLSGVINSVDGNKITVTYRRKDRTFTINDKTKINYVSFLKAKKEIKPGFYYRAAIDPQSDGTNAQCHQLWVTLPIPEEKLIPSTKMLTMTPAELHKMSDINGDGELSYVEYATAIIRSPKHGPVGFMKSDKDKSGTLNLKEFTPKLVETKWYRISRKTPAQWHAEADADSNGVLSKQEFVTVLGTTAHLDTRFKQTDKDRSSDLSVQEVAGYINTILE